MRNLLLVLLVAFSTTAIAQKTEHGFFGGKEEGWFWYKDPREARLKQPIPTTPEPEKKEPAPTKETAIAKEEKIPAFSVKWIRENLDKLRDIAIDDPTPENVRNYYYAQRIMLDKADKFASVAKQVVTTDPYLDENNNFPFATAARANIARLQTEAKKEGLKHLAGKAGLWFFFDSKCSFCSMQVSTVNHLAQNYGFEVKAITLDGRSLPDLKMPVVRDQGQFKTLNLTITPTLVLAVPPKTFLVISQGVLSDSAADERLLTVAATQKLLPPEISRQIDVYSKGVLDPEDMNSEEAKALRDDPKAWVEYLQGRLKQKY
jgi:conjugal transfer pilus assembly protein TraF